MIERNKRINKFLSRQDEDHQYDEYQRKEKSDKR